MTGEEQIRAYEAEIWNGEEEADIKLAVEVQQRYEFAEEIRLIEKLERFGWNSPYAERIAGKAWAKIYGEAE